MLAVIPTSVLAAPLAIIAMLFPAVFGGLVLLGRRWRAFLLILSLTTTVCFLYDWPLTGEWLRSTLQIDLRSLLLLITIVNLLGGLWSWRRQLTNLPPGQKGEPPVRAERWALWISTGLTLITLLILWLWVGKGSLKLDSASMFLLVTLTGGVSFATVYALAIQMRASSPREKPILSIEGIILSTMALIGVILTTGPGFSTGRFQGEAGGQGGSEGKEEIRLVGAPLWEYVPEKNLAEISSTPLVNGNYLYAAINYPGPNFIDRRATLYCLDLTKDPTKESPVVWEFHHDDQLRQMFSSPRLAEGRIYFGEGYHENRGCNLFCVDAKTGKKLWTFETTSHTESTPAIVNGKVYFGAGDDGLYCIDAADGKKIWQYPDPENAREGLHIDAPPVVVGSKVFCCSGVSQTYRKLQIFCLDSKTGKAIWTRDDIDLPAWGAPAVKGDRVYVGLGNGRITISDPDPKGSVQCLDAKTGNRLWTFDRMKDAVHARPVVDDHHVMVGSRDGSFYCLDRWSGRLRWKQDFESPIVASAAIAQCPCCGASTSVYVAAMDGSIQCLNPLNGKVQWKHRELTQFATQLIPSLSVVVIPEEDGERRRIYLGATVQGSTTVLQCLEDVRKSSASH